MGIRDWWRRRQRARHLRPLLERGDVAAVRDLLGDDPEALKETADALLDEGRLDLGRALLGHAGGSTLDALLAAPAADRERERLLAEAKSLTLPTDERALSLADMLVDRGERPAARRLLERAAKTRGSWAVVRAAIERAIEDEDWKGAWPLIDASLATVRHERLHGTPDHEFLLQAHQLVLGHLESAESVTVDLMMRGELDPFSGVNHLLLAKALMKQGPLATRLELVPATQELREGEERLRRDRSDAAGLCLVGSARLRLGEPEEAMVPFARGRDVAPRHFALVAGYGAAKLLVQERHLARVQALPALDEPAHFAAVLPDAAAFTALERKVALASVVPLVRWFPRLEGARLRVLPLDVRVTDLPEFERLRNEVEARDQRSWDALGGLAGDGLACVRVEEVFQLDELRWALAHELAHLVHRVLPAQHVDAIRAAWRRACEHEFAFDQYQLTNEHEFFAVTYTRWLTRRYGLPLSHEPDGEGHLARALACIDEVAGVSSTSGS